MALENDKKLPNIKALRNFMLKGKKVNAGDVVAKSDFPNTGDFMNLCAMTPARAEQTDAKVGKAPRGKAGQAAKPKAAEAPALPGS